MNGKVIEGKVECDDCGIVCKVGGVKPRFVYYYCNGYKLCRGCAKRRKVI